MGTRRTDAGGVGTGENAALAHGDDVFGELWDKAFAQAEVTLEDGEVAVVDADDAGAVSDGAVKFRLGMDFKKGVEPCELGGFEKRGDLGVGKGADDDEDGAGAGLASLKNLDGVNHEVLADARNRGTVLVEERSHPDKVVEGAAKVFFVGEDGQGVGAGLAIFQGLFGRGEGGGGDGAGGGRAALDLGDDGEFPVAAAQGAGEGRRFGSHGVKRGQLGQGNRADERGNFLPLPGHDLGEFVKHLIPTEHRPDAEHKAEKISVCSVASAGNFRRMSAVQDLRKTIAALRAPGGCPWDQVQTHATLTRCLIDEASELLDTIDRLDMPHMREELGDVLMQVVFHAQLAEEAGHFDLEAVAAEANEKLVRRHPHVFGAGAKIGTPEEVIVKWEQIKAQEKKNGPVQSGVFKDLPPRLPALMFAETVWKQIVKKELPAEGVVDVAKIKALGAQLDAVALGKILFEVTAAARAKGLDPEGALRLHTTQVMRDVEALLAATPS